MTASKRGTNPRSHGNRGMNHLARVLDRCVAGENGCVVFTGATNRKGYGTVAGMGAHRYVYLRMVGPIPAETLDHLCRNKRCVNPDHLEPVSIRENVRRYWHG